MADHWTYSGAKLTARAAPPIAIFILTGVAGIEVLAQMFVDIARWLGERPNVLAHVQDFGAASVVHVTTSALTKASLANSNPGHDLQPAAIIPPPDRMAMFRDYASAMCDRGIGRSVLTDRFEARAWAFAAARDRADFLGAGEAASPRRHRPSSGSAPGGHSKARKQLHVDAQGSDRAGRRGALHTGSGRH